MGRELGDPGQRTNAIIKEGVGGRDLRFRLRGTVKDCALRTYWAATFG